MTSHTLDIAQGERVPSSPSEGETRASSSPSADVGSLSLEELEQIEDTDAPPRRWDDPPSHEPPGLPQQVEESSVILLLKRRFKFAEALSIMSRGVTTVTFTPSDSHVIIMAPVMPLVPPRIQPDSSNLSAWNVETGARVLYTLNSPPTIAGGFACTPITAGDNAIAAVSYHRDIPPQSLHVFDLNLNKRRFKVDLPIRAPIAWSPSGRLLAAVSALDPCRIHILKLVGADGITLQQQIPHHLGRVTHLAFMPDGTAVVSLSKDGTGRVTSLASGRTMRKFEAEARQGPRLLQVSLSGEMIVSVWGWDVMQWHPGTGRMVVYNLNAARPTEGWPLSISPDCQFLVCRTEDGFDIMDLPTGRFLGEATADSGELSRTGYVSSAAISSDNSAVVVAKSNGEVKTYEMIVVS